MLAATQSKSCFTIFVIFYFRIWFVFLSSKQNYVINELHHLLKVEQSTNIVCSDLTLPQKDCSCKFFERIRGTLSQDLGLLVMCIFAPQK